MADRLDPWNMLGALIVACLAAIFAWAVLHPHQAIPPVDPRPAPEPPAVKRQFVYIGASWCAHCGRMERDTLKSPRVADRLAAAFTVIKLSGKEAAQRYGATAYPTYLILDGSGRELRRGTGYRGSEELLAWLDITRPPINSFPASQVEDEP